MESEPTVVIIDDDPAVRKVLTAQVGSMHLRTKSFGSAQAFLDSCDRSEPGCILLESRTPETGGLEPLVRLRRDEPHLPVILISARGDVPTVVQAMKAGALNFLQKPVRDHELREAIQEGFRRDRDHRRQAVEQGKLQQRITRLSPGERDVLRMLIDGKSNKRMATDLAMSVRTIEVRRAKLMQKMKAGSLAELVRLAMGAGESLGKPDGEL